MSHEQPFEVQTSEELAAAIEAATASEDSPPPGKIDQLSRQSFDELSGGVVRAKHAEEAMLNPDQFAILRFGDAPDLYLSTKRVSSFVVIAIGAGFNQKTVVQAAYRLYGDEKEVEELTGSAPLAFRTLLEQFGNRFGSKGREVLFVPVLSAPIRETPEKTIEAALNLDMSAESHWGAHVAARQNGGQLELSWPFVIDLIRYKAVARACGWKG